MEKRPRLLVGGELAPCAWSNPTRSCSTSMGRVRATSLLVECGDRQALARSLGPELAEARKFLALQMLRARRGANRFV